MLPTATNEIGHQRHREYRAAATNESHHESERTARQHTLEDVEHRHHPAD